MTYTPGKAWTAQSVATGQIAELPSVRRAFYDAFSQNRQAFEQKLKTDRDIESTFLVHWRLSRPHGDRDVPE